MIHHTCEHADAEHPLIAAVGDGGKATAAVMDYAGNYRCGECHRMVRIDVSEKTWRRDLETLPRVEPPYPDGWCGDE